MKYFKTAAMLFMLSATAGLAQTTFRTGTVYNTGGAELSVVPRSLLNIKYTWYGPEIFNYPNGDIGFYAHSSNPSVEATGHSYSNGVASAACGSFSPAGVDDIYNAHRNSAGAWTTPAWAQCPAIKGMVHCANAPDGKIDATGSPSIVRIANPYSSTGFRYYMLFNNGNSDSTVGKVYWAVSDDGDNWTIYVGTPPAGYQWKPMLGPEYLGCDAGPAANGGHGQGISEALLVFDPNDTAGGRNPSGTFYIYFDYTHYTPAIGQFEDVYAFRFGYNPAHPFGFGSNPEIYFRGAWVAHSGRLVWDYDQRLPIGTDPVLFIGESMKLSWRENTPHSIGRGDLKQNPNTGVWYHLSTWGGKWYMQWNTRLDMDNWSVPVEINTASVNAYYPPQCRITLDANSPTENIAYDPGLWYGTAGNWTGWWMFQPVHAVASNVAGRPPTCFTGLGIVVTKLCMNEQTGCDQ